MARRTKPTLQSLDYSSSSAPTWAKEYRTANSVENRESRALAAIAALEEQGAALTDQQKLDILNQTVRTGNFTVADTPEADFSAVQDNAVVLPQTAPTEDVGFFRGAMNNAGAVVDALQAGAYRDSAAVLGRMGRSENPVFSGPARQIGAVVDALTSPVLPQDGGVEISEIINRFTPSEQALAAGLAKLRSGADRNMAESSRVLNPVIERGGASGLLARTAQDAAQSGASSAVSLVGGPLAAISAGGVTYANSYEEAISKGLTPAEAEEYAIGQGVIEGGVSFIPAERLVSRIPGVRQGLQRLTGTGVRSLDNMIASPAIATAARTAASIVGEGVGEAGTEFTQSLAAAAQAGQAENERQRNFLNKSADLENLGENVTRAGLAGALMGGAISAPINTVQERQRYNERVAQTRDNTAQNIRDSFNEASATAPVVPAEASTQPATYGMDAPNLDRELYNAEQDVARQAEIDRAFEQREVEERLQREVEEEAGFRTMEAQNASGPMADQLRSVINTEVTPEDVAAERITQNRIEQRGVGSPSQATPTAQEPQVPAVVASATTPARRNRNAPKRKVAAPVAELEASTDPDDQRAAAIMKLVGGTLGMSAPQTASVAVPADFNQKVDSIASALASDSSREAAAVEQLIADRRLVVAPNPSSIGRSDPGLDAAYDTGTGMMYVYTDGMGSNPLAYIMTAVPHEGTHAGQGQSRDGRSQAMQALLGSEGPATLRQLAAQGHTGAAEALRKAQADTEARRTRGEENPERYEDVELAAYFVGDLRGRSPGRARGAVNSMVASARNTMRERLGVDLPINATDLEAAARRVVEEVAVTPPLTRETLNPEVLGMIYNQNSRGFDEALANGYVYDSVDGRQKYVLSDEDALIRTGAPERVAQSNEPTPIGEVLNHEVLFREHPEAANIPVFAADNLGDGTTFAFYDPNANEIWVRRDIANATNTMANAPTFKGALMHELQHYVQDQGDYSSEFFDGEAASQAMDNASEQFKQANDTLDVAARWFLDNILATIPSQQDKNRVMRQIMRPASTDTEMASRVRDTVQELENVTPEASALIETYEQARADRNAAARQLIAARDNQHNEYLRNITEREAHFTQYQTEASQMGMEDTTTGINPEPLMRQQEADPDTGVDPTQGVIDVPVDGPEGRQVQARSQEAQRLAELEARIAQMEAEDGRDFDLIERLQETPLYRGNRDGATSTFSSDGALGPGHYYTSDRGAAQSYGPNVQSVLPRVNNPLVITMEQVNANEGNTAAAIANNEAFSNENFNTRGAANRWAREQWDDWSGVGDPEFQSMARDAGFDSVFLMDGDAVVEANIFRQRDVVANEPDTLGMAANTSPIVTTAYHGTNAQFDRFEHLSGEVGFHFGGNREQAEHRSRNGRIIEATLSFNNPLRMTDLFYWGGPEVVRELRNKKLVPDSTLRKLDAALQEAPAEAIRTGERLSTQQAVTVANTLVAEGYDGIVYRNRGEGGGTAYIALSNDVISYPSSDTLGMAANTTPSTESTPFRNRRFGTTILSLLRNDKGLGKAVRDAVELASPFVAPIEARSNQYVGEYQDALNKMAVAQGKTYAELNNEIRDALAEIQDMEGTPSQYKAAFNAVANKYGAAGQALRQLRNLNDDLSRSIIDTYLNRGGKLTKAEAQELESVVNNLGRYVHRFYASRVPGDAGKTYRDSVWNTIQKHKQGKKLTPKEKEVYDVYSRAAKTLLEDMYIPDAEGLSKLKQERVDYLYGTWVVNKEMGATRDQKLAALEAKREQITPAEMERQLDITSKALLYPFDDTSPVSTFYNRGAKRDNTIMKQRQTIPKEIRDFMGEITDPMGALMVTASKQAEWVARTNMFLELQQVADANDLQPPGSARSAEVERNNMTELKGSEFGPMEGWYASPAMRAMIDGTRESLMTLTDAVTTGQNYETVTAKLVNNAAKAWSTAASTAKYTSVVFNIVRMSYNAAGSLVMPAFNGNFNPATYARGLQDAANLIRYATNPKTGLGSAEDAVRFRVVDSATVGDLKSLDRPFLNELVKELAGKDSSGVVRTLGRYVSSGKMLLRESYAMADVWAKIANFHNEVDYLTKLYNDAGISKTENEIKREASTIVNDTNIGWLRTAPVVKAMERGGISMFGAYMYDTFRVQLTNMAQGVADVRRAADMPNAKSKARATARGMSRIGGQLAYWGMFYALSKSLGSMFGEDEDKKREVGLYDGMTYEDYINVGIGEDGKARLFRFSDFDPLGPALNLMRAARAGGEVEDVWKSFLGAYIAPSIAGVGTTAVMQTAANVTDGEDEYVRTPVMEEWFANNFYNKMLDTGESWGVKPNTVRAWNSVGETILMPGTMRAWTKSNLTPLTPATPETFDTVASNMYSAMRYAGARATTYDPKIGGRAAREAYSVAVSNARKGMADYIKRTTDPTPEEILSKATEYVRQEKEAWDKVEKMYEGMTALGMNDKEIDGALGDGFPSLSKSTLTQVKRGEFSSVLFDKSSFQQRAKASIDRARTQKEKEELTERWENAWDVLQMYKGVE